MGLFRRKRQQTAKAHYEVADVYAGLRAMLFDPSRRPDDWAADAVDNLWAGVMEMGYDEAVGTLVMTADGAVSLYFSNGGGFIGMGEHEGPREKAREFLTFAHGFLDRARPNVEYPLPQLGQTRFYFLTVDGPLATDEVREDELAAGGHSLSPLFYKAHEVITEMRLVEEATRAAGAGT